MKQGASLETGGAQFGDKGFFMQPTVFADVQDHMDISTQEVTNLYYLDLYNLRFCNFSTQNSCVRISTVLLLKCYFPCCAGVSRYSL